MQNKGDQQVHDDDRFDRIRIRLVSGAGLLLPFLASIPPMTAWGALMTVPFITYIILLLGNVSTTPLYPADITNIIAVFAGIVLLFYSIVYLWRRKATGLVVSGPYRIVRHPQYFSIIVFTTVVTYQSVWILRNTFGIGWLDESQTIALWIAMLAAYTMIATVEELHLEKSYGSVWREYREHVGFLIPFVKFKSRIVEAFISVVFPVLFLYGLLLISA